MHQQMVLSADYKPTEHCLYNKILQYVLILSALECKWR